MLQPGYEPPTDVSDCVAPGEEFVEVDTIK